MYPDILNPYACVLWRAVSKKVFCPLGSTGSSEQGICPVLRKLNGNYLDPYIQEPWVVFAAQRKVAVCYSV